MSAASALLMVVALTAQTPSYVPAPTSPPIAVQSADLQWQYGIMASRSGDARLYVLLGSGFIRPFTSPELEAVAGRWLADHPAATVTPISRLLSTNTRSHRQGEIVYVWIEDGSASLNVDLVAAGMVAGAAMQDMVDNRRGLDEFLKRPSMKGARAEIVKERAAAPQDRAERLVTGPDYALRLRLVESAERSARSGKRGIWSDAMREERAAEDMR